MVKKGEVDYNYSFLFRVICAKRNLILGAKTINDRQQWINGFNVLFEFRESQTLKLQKVMPQSFGNSNTIDRAGANQRS